MLASECLIVMPGREETAMRKAGQIALLITTCLGVAGVTHVIRGQLLRAKSGDFKEFTITRNETSQSRNPHHIRRVVFEAQRSDGSRVTGEVTPTGTIAARRFATLVPEGIQVRIDDSLRAKTTRYFRNNPPPTPPIPDPECGLSRLSPDTKPSYKGEAPVLGIRTVAIQTEETIEDGESFLRTQWQAPDLDCAVLRVSEDRRDNIGHITGHFEIQALKVVVGTPDPKLFEVPPDYAEMSPSQMHEALTRQSVDPGRPLPESMRRRLEREDQRYFENHQAAAAGSGAKADRSVPTPRER
jgi:hypothetical protein